MSVSTIILQNWLSCRIPPGQLVSCLYKTSSSSTYCTPALPISEWVCSDKCLSEAMITLCEVVTSDKWYLSLSSTTKTKTGRFSQKMFWSTACHRNIYLSQSYHKNSGSITNSLYHYSNGVTVQCSDVTNTMVLSHYIYINKIYHKTSQK